MKKNKYISRLIYFFSILILSQCVFSQTSIQGLDTLSNSNFYQIKEIWNNYWNSIPEYERKGWKQYKRWEYFWEPRVYPSGNFPDANRILYEWNCFKEKYDRNDVIQSKQWSLIGPIDNPENFNDSRDQGLGRINVIKFNPHNVNEIWVGAASGGIWKSSDGGISWITFPFTEFLSIGITDIAISKTNPNIVYASTGDADVTFGGRDKFYSIGLIKTTNGGSTWNITNLSYYLHNNKILGNIIIHPTNPNILVVGTGDGIYKTIDGGVTWINKQSGGFRDLVIHPTRNNIIYGATFSRVGEAYIYKSTDFGDSWKSVKKVENCIRIALAVTPDNYKKVYAICANSQNRGFHSFIVSTDEGENWQTIATPERIGNILGWYRGESWDNKGQGSYDLCISVSPVNEQLIYIGGINIWKTTDGGETWDLVTHWYGGYGKAFVHADHHDLEFQNNTTLFSGNDGGIYKTTNGGENWINLSNGLSITQYYCMGMSKTNPPQIIGGSQDNGTTLYKDNEWFHIFSSDGMECAINPKNNKNIYVSIYYGSLYRSTNGGNDFDLMIDADKVKETGEWVTRFVIDQVSPNNIYAGYNNVWKSSKYGEYGTWSKISNFTSGGTIHSLAIAPNNSGIIYAATLSNLYATYNDGQEWVELYKSNAGISYIAVDPNDPLHIFLTMSGYVPGIKVFEYDGEKFINVSGNLPNLPINCAVVQENSQSRIYIGTDIGVFYTDFGSNIWTYYGTGLPNVVVNELEIDYQRKKLVAATYGRGFWEIDLLDCNLKEVKVTINGNTEFCSGDSVVLEAEDGYDSYLWSDGSNSRSVIIKTSGNYSVEAKKLSNMDVCRAKSRTIQINVKTTPELRVNVNGNNPMCEGDSLELNAWLGFSKYEWSNGKSGRKIYVKDSGEYILKATATNGCFVYSQPIRVVVNPLPEKPVIYKVKDTLISSKAERYKWYWNGSPLENAEDRFLIIKEYGVYQVEVYNEFDCKKISDPFIFSSINFHNDSNEIVLIYPNPGSEYISIYSINENDIIYKIEIVDIIGRIHYSWNSNDFLENPFSINLSTFISGIYFIKIYNQNGVIVRKIVKK